MPGTIRAPGRAILSNGSGLGLLIGSDAGTNVMDVMDVSDPSNTYSFVNRVGLPAAPDSVAVASQVSRTSPS